MWTSPVLKFEAPVSDGRHRFDYGLAIQGSAAVGGCKSAEVRQLEVDSDDAMYDFIPKRRRLTYTANPKVIEEINKTLGQYAQDVTEPVLPLTLPVHLGDFENSLIRREIQAPVADPQGNMPDRNSTCEISQLEITRLDALNRALIKIHESDRAIMAGVMKFMKRLTETAERPDAQIDWIQSEVKHARPVDMMRAVCRNAVSREAMLGQIHGVTLAVRRRDNALRLNLTPEQVRELVAKPVSSDMIQEEKPTLLDLGQRLFCE